MSSVAELFQSFQATGVKTAGQNHGPDFQHPGFLLHLEIDGPKRAFLLAPCTLPAKTPVDDEGFRQDIRDRTEDRLPGFSSGIGVLSGAGF
jgi:hypothetical protein